MMVLLANFKVFDAVLSLQAAISNMPSQIEFDNPVVFEDAHGYKYPIHLQWTDSWDVCRTEFSRID